MVLEPKTVIAPSRKEVAKLIEDQMYRGPSNSDKNHFHYGYVELRELMDFIYGGPPTCKEEELGVD